GGTYRDPADAFPRWAVLPERLLSLIPEIQLESEQRRAFLQQRGGAIVGRQTAEDYDIRVGQRLAIIPDIWPNKDGTAWELDVVGIFDSDDRAVDLTALYLDYAYFDEYRSWGTGQVTYLLVALDGS